MMDRLVAFTEQISKGTADVRVTQWLGRPEVAGIFPHGKASIYHNPMR